MDEIKHYCSECSHELTLIKGQYDFHGYCPECFNFEGTIRDNNYCCMKPDLIMVRHTIRDGRFQIKVQCGFCAVSQGPCYPFKSVMFSLVWILVTLIYPCPARLRLAV